MRRALPSAPTYCPYLAICCRRMPPPFSPFASIIPGGDNICFCSTGSLRRYLISHRNAPFNAGVNIFDLRVRTPTLRRLTTRIAFLTLQHHQTFVDAAWRRIRARATAATRYPGISRHDNTCGIWRLLQPGLPLSALLRASAPVRMAEPIRVCTAVYRRATYHNTLPNFNAPRRAARFHLISIVTVRRCGTLC